MTGARPSEEIPESLDVKVNQVDAQRDIAQAPVSVTKVMEKSQQHKDIISKDVQGLSSVEKFIKYTGNAFKGKNVGGDLFDLKNKEVNGQLTKEELWKMFELEDEYKGILKSQQDLDFNFGESFVSETAAGLFDLVLSTVRTPGPLLIGVGGAATAGAAIGSLALNPIGGAAIGGLAGIGPGLLVTQILDGYKQGVGATFYEFETDPDFKDFPDAERKSLAKGAGVLMGLVSIIPTVTGLRNTPFFKRFGPKWLMGKLKSSPAAKSLLKRIVQTSAAEAGEEGLQEYIQAIAVAMGKTWDGEETNFFDGVENALTDAETHVRALKAAAIGAAVGGAAQVSGNILGAGLDKVTGAERSDITLNKDLSDARDVTPTETIVGGEFGLLEAPQTDLVDSDVPTTIKGNKAIALKILTNKVIDKTEGTETNRLIPEDLDEVIQNMYEANGVGDMYFDKKDLEEWANTKDKQEDLVELLGNSGQEQAIVDAPIKVKSHKVVKLARKNRDLLNLVKESPEGPPVNKWEEAIRSQEMQTQEDAAVVLEEGVEAPVVTEQAAKIIERHEQFIASQEASREAAEKVLTTSDDPVAQRTAERAIRGHEENIAMRQARIDELKQTPDAEIRRRDSEIFDESDFLSQETYTEEFIKVLPEKEVNALNEIERSARIEVAESIRAEASKGMQKIKPMNAHMLEELDSQKIREEISNSTTVQIVEDFLNNNKVIGDLSKEDQKVFDSGRPVHAIDPESLTDDLKFKYANDPSLKKRRAFRKGGLPISEVVGTYQAKDADSLLTILRDTPTYDEHESAQVQRREEETKELHEGDIDIVEGRIAKAYEKVSKLHLKTGKKLRNASWPTFRQGIERVALDIPRLNSELDVEARAQVGNTKVKDLNVNQYAVAERRSHKKGVRSFLRGKLEEGFREKTNAAKSAQIAKHTRISIGKVNRAFKRIAKFSDKQLRAELGLAGAEFEGAVRFFLGTYNFVPGLENDMADLKSFIDKMRGEGRLEFDIDPKILEWLEPSPTPGEMKVDQVLFIDSYLRQIRRRAKNQLKLMRKDETDTIDLIAERLHETAIKNVNYKEGRDQLSAGIPDGWDSLHYGASMLEGMVANNQVIYQEMDGKLVGDYYKSLHLPLLGTTHYESPTGLKASSEMSGKINKKVGKAIKKFFKNQRTFSDYGVTTINVTELKGLKNFKNGLIRKDQLLMMLANMGNESNQAYLENYGLSVDTAWTILKRELKQSDFDFVQEAMWGTFRSLAPQLNAVYRARTGVDLDLIKGTSFTAFGKTYEGGFFPALLKGDMSFNGFTESIKSEMDASNPLKANSHVNHNPAYEGIVRSPHTKTRLGSSEVLDLRFDRFSEAIDSMVWDITMSQPIRDVMDVLTNDRVKSDIINQVGKPKYNILVNNVANLTKSLTATNARLHSEIQGVVEGVISKLENAAAISWIGFSLSSMAMSSETFNTISLKMGFKNAGKYLPLATTKLLSSMAVKPFSDKYFKELTTLAVRLDPSFNFYTEGLTDSKVTAIGNMIPKERVISKAWNPLKKVGVVAKTYNRTMNAIEGAAEFSLGGVLGNIDKFIKLSTIAAVRSMYLNGDAEGHSYESVHVGKTLEEVNAEMEIFIGQFLEDTTIRASVYDKTPLQQTPLGKRFTRFMSESLRSLNVVLRETKNIKRDAKRMSADLKNNDFDGAAENLWGAGEKSFNVLMWSFVALAIGNTVRFGAPFFSDEEDAEKFAGDSRTSLPEFIGYHLSPLDPTADITGSERIRRGLEGFNSTFGARIPGYGAMGFSFSTTSPHKGVPRFGVSVPALSVTTDIVGGIGTALRAAELLDYGVNFGDLIHVLSPKEMRSLLMTTSYMFGGIPGTGQLSKLHRNFVFNDDLGLPKIPIPSINPAKLIEIINRKLGDDKDEPPKNPTTGQEELKEELKDIKSKLKPVPKGAILDEEAWEIIKHTESRGKWNAQNKKSTAAGLFQFTESTWNKIMNSPEGVKAGITPNGRISKRNPQQQEKAVRILGKMNAQVLRNQGVPINVETIYFAHHFGPGLAKQVYLADPKSKLKRGEKQILSPKVLEANPVLVKGDPESGLKPVKTAGDMRRFIKWNLDRGFRSFQGEVLR